MDRADLLYSGLIVIAAVLSLGTAVLVTAACCFFARALSNPPSSELRPTTDQLPCLAVPVARSSRLGAPS